MDKHALTQDIIKRAGGPSLVSRVLKRPHNTICQWRRIPVQYAAIIAKLANIDEKEINPLKRVSSHKSPEKLNPTEQQEYLLSIARAAIVGRMTELVVKEKVAPRPDFARKRVFERRLAIYVAAVAVENISAPWVGHHFGVSHTVVTNAREEFENLRENDDALDKLLDELCHDVAIRAATYGI